VRAERNEPNWKGGSMYRERDATGNFIGRRESWKPAYPKSLKMAREGDCCM